MSKSLAKSGFSVGELVVYPAHGVGVVEGIETQEIAGTKLNVLVVYFKKDKMKVRLPINKTIGGKLRKLCTKEEIDEVLECLKVPVRVKKSMWSRRAQEYESKLNSGVPLSIAQVVRELYRSSSQPEHSYSERQIYHEALHRLTSEFAAVTNMDEEEARAKLEDILCNKKVA